MDLTYFDSLQKLNRERESTRGVQERTARIRKDIKKVLKPSTTGELEMREASEREEATESN